MSSTWIILLGIVLVTAIVTMIGRWKWRGRQSDLGSVSHRWVAEERMSKTKDPQR